MERRDYEISVVESLRNLVPLFCDPLQHFASLPKIRVVAVLVEGYSFEIDWFGDYRL